VVRMEQSKETKGIRMGIRAKMLLFFGGAVAVSLVFLSYLNLFGVPFTGIKGSYRIHRDEVIQKINDVADLKKENIEHWFKERTNHIKVFAGNTEIDVISARFKNGMAHGEDKSSLFKEVRNTAEYIKILQRAKTVLNNNPDYLEIRIADIKTGLVVFSTDEKNTGKDLSDNKEIKNAGDPGIAEQVYFRKEKTSGNKRLNIIYPIMPKRMAGDAEAPSFAAMLVIDPERRLIPYFHSGTGLGKSGEIIMIDMNRIILTPLKYTLPGNRKAEPLEYMLDTKSGELAAWGIDGIIFAKDYRGVPIIAGIRHMRITSEYGVGLIAKIDEKEVLNFAREGLVTSLFISSFGLLFLLWIIYFVSGRIARPVTQLSHTAQKIMEGNLGERSLIKTTDEIGRLAGSFNSMVEELQKWHEELETKVSERTAELYKSEARYNFALEMGQTGAWDLNLIDHTAHRSLIHDRIFGYETLLPNWTYEMFLEHILPEDRQEVNRRFTEATASQTDWSFECRIRRVDGEIRWIWAVGGHERNSEGKSVRMSGIVQDITDRKLAEEALHDVLLKQNEAVRAANVGLWEWDLVNNKVRYSAEWKKQIGYEDHEIGDEFKEWENHVHPDDLGPTLEKIKASIDGRHKNHQTEFRFRHKDGSYRWILAQASIIQDKSGVPVKMVGSHIDITERKLVEIELEKHKKNLEKLVRERTGELEDAQKALTNIVEDLNEKSIKLEEANIRLRELDRLKSMFIASMSHELRTPLNSIIGFSSILLNEWVGPLTPEQKENIGIVLRSGKHLLALINDVIDISKIEADKIEIFVEEFDLFGLLSEAVSTHSKDILNKGIELKVENMHLMMQTDRRRLLQCILNLMSNAAKFTEKGSITMQARIVNSEQYAVNSKKELFTDDYLLITDAGFVEISVNDTGIGIREEDLPKLFLPFVRIDSPLKATVSGTGLGLYLTKKLVNQVLKGEVWVESRFGEGSTFRIVIPAKI
jgi:PAS domain S-box-containing protein